MKILKTFLTVVILNICTLGICQPLMPPSRSVNDIANILTDSEESGLNDSIDTMEVNGSVDIAITTIESLEGKNIDSYTMELGDSWGIGKEKKNGLMILLSVRDRKISIRTGNNLASTITNNDCNSIVSKMTPYFKQSKYFDGFKAGLNDVPGLIANTTSLILTPKKVGQIAEENVSGFSLLMILLFLSVIVVIFVIIKIVLFYNNKYQSLKIKISNKLVKIDTIIKSIVVKNQRFNSLKENIDEKFPKKEIPESFEFDSEEYENIYKELKDSFQFFVDKGFIHHLTNENLDNIKKQCDDLYKTLETTESLINGPISVINEYNKKKDEASKLCFSMEKNIKKLRKEENITTKQLEELALIETKLLNIMGFNDPVKNYNSICKLNKDINNIDACIKDFEKKKKESIRLAGEISKKIEKIKSKKKLSSKKLEKISVAEQKLIAVNESVNNGGTDWLQAYLIYSALNNDCKSIDAPAPSSYNHSHSNHSYDNGGGSSHDYGSSSSYDGGSSFSSGYDGGGSSFDSGGGGGGDW